MRPTSLHNSPVCGYRPNLDETQVVHQVPGDTGGPYLISTGKGSIRVIMFRRNMTMTDGCRRCHLLGITLDPHGQLKRYHVRGFEPVTTEACIRYKTLYRACKVCEVPLKKIPSVDSQGVTLE